MKTSNILAVAAILLLAAGMAQADITIETVPGGNIGNTGSAVAHWSLDEASLPQFTESYSGSIHNVPAGVDWSLTLPKFDTQGGTRQLVEVTLESTTTATQGTRMAQNQSYFAGTVDVLTLTLSAECNIFVHTPFPAVPRPDTSEPFIPSPTFSFGPVDLKASLPGPMVLAAAGDPGDTVTVSLAGHTTGLQQQTVSSPSNLLNSFIISSGGDSTILFVTASGSSVSLDASGIVVNSRTSPAIAYTMTGQVTYEYIVLSGDTNGDGVVDAADYITLKRNMGESTSSGASNGDFNGDGTVDWDDLQTLMSTFGTGVGATATTPEPATMSLLALGGLAVIRRKRKKIICPLT